MSRKSRREIERAIETLEPAAADDGEPFSDAREGVTASFVTYEADADPEPPVGATVTETPTTGDAVFHVVHSSGEGGDRR